MDIRNYHVLIIILWKSEGIDVLSSRPFSPSRSFFLLFYSTRTVEIILKHYTRTMQRRETMKSTAGERATIKKLLNYLHTRLEQLRVIRYVFLNFIKAPDTDFEIYQASRLLSTWTKNFKDVRPDNDEKKMTEREDVSFNSRFKVILTLELPRWSK